MILVDTQFFPHAKPKIWRENSKNLAVIYHQLHPLLGCMHPATTRNYDESSLFTNSECIETGIKQKCLKKMGAIQNLRFLMTCYRMGKNLSFVFVLLM